MTSATTYVNLEEDDFQQNQMEKSLKRRKIIKISVFVILILMIAALSGVIVQDLLAPKGEEFDSAAWKSEITSEEYNEFSNEDKLKVFDHWKSEYNRSYASDDEHNQRFGLWDAAWAKIAETNSNDLSYKLQMNKFGDLSDEEFKTYYTTAKSQPPYGEGVSYTPIITASNRRRLSDSSIDWTDYSYVTSVKDQGQCGSCYAFATTGCLECVIAVFGGGVTSMSEQQLMDCSSDFETTGGGCDGSYVDLTMQYVENNNGLCTESAYPYTGTASSGSCKSSDCSAISPIKNIYYASPDDSSSLESYVSYACTAVSIQADGTTFQYYSSGILDDDTCGSSTDHAVLAVGYGTDSSGSAFWKVKNSWGSDWGEDGYIRLCKDCGKNNGKGQCGILTSPLMMIPNSDTNNN